MSNLRILVAEDLPADIMILQRAFTKAGIDVPLHFVSDGQQAIDYLSGEGHFADLAPMPRPTMLLLDLKMPRLNGFDVIEWIRRQPELRRLLVVVFTSSELPEDINQAYELGANSYLVKPSEFAELEELARTLEKYWFRFNYCPDSAPGQKTGGPINPLFRTKTRIRPDDESRNE